MNKTFLKLFLLSSLILSSSLMAAESVIIKETATWKSIPITVDQEKHVYTVTGTVPADVTEYYYTYPGYRCFVEKREVVGVNALVFNASISGGSDIYCYPE